MSLLSRDYAWYIPFSFAARRPEYPGPCAVSSQKPLAFFKRRWPNSNGHASESQCDTKCNQPSLIFRVYVTPALAARKSPPALCLPGKRPPGARALGANVALRAAGPRLRPRRQRHSSCCTLWRISDTSGRRNKHHPVLFSDHAQSVAFPHATALPGYTGLRTVSRLALKCRRPMTRATS